MNRKEVETLSPGNKVIPRVGYYKDEWVTVVKVELDSGARNGWVTCNHQGTNLMYAGEEIDRAPTTWTNKQVNELVEAAIELLDSESKENEKKVTTMPDGRKAYPIGGNISKNAALYRIDRALRAMGEIE